MRAINIVFTSLFTIESILKIIGFGFKNYFRDSWNTFDFITVIGSIVDAVISEYTVRFLLFLASLSEWSVSLQVDSFLFKSRKKMFIIHVILFANFHRRKSKER